MRDITTTSERGQITLSSTYTALRRNKQAQLDILETGETLG